MSKEELIQYIEELKNERAFSEEDRFLLEIIDNSPFTIWASDRDCKIRFWEGQCETLYGYKKRQVIGEDFVDLFVAEDEQKAAREDQLKIIDHGEIFHNIANDHAKNGNTLRLLTNCWRMKGPNTDEYWNVEMGLIVDFFYQEMERLEEIISESRLYKARITQFVDLTKQMRHQYTERKKSFNEEIRECHRKAVLAKKGQEFNKSAESAKKMLKELDKRLIDLINQYLQSVQGCSSSERCEELTESFKEEFDELIGNFEDGVILFEEMAIKFTPDGVVLGKDTVFKETSVEFEKHYGVAFDLKLSINQRIDRYKAQVTANRDSKVLRHYTELLKKVEAIIKRMKTVQDKVFKDIGTAQTYDSVNEIRAYMHDQYNEIENELTVLGNLL